MEDEFWGGKAGKAFWQVSCQFLGMYIFFKFVSYSFGWRSKDFFGFVRFVLFLFWALLNMGVSKNRDGPPKWMVKIHDLGVPLFLETPI